MRACSIHSAVGNLPRIRLRNFSENCKKPTGKGNDAGFPPPQGDSHQRSVAPRRPPAGFPPPQGDSHQRSVAPRRPSAGFLLPRGTLLPGRRRASKRQSPGEGKGPVELYAESEALSRIFRPAAQAGQSHHFPPRALTSRA